jgi:hypothetical protein
VPINLGFGNVPRSNVKPDGDYVVTIEDCTTAPSKKTKDLPEEQHETVATVKYTFDEPSEFNGQKMTEWVSFAPDALWSARDWLEAVYGEEIDEDFTFDEADMVGRKVGLVLDGKGEYPKGSGKAQNRIIGYFTV